MAREERFPKQNKNCSSSSHNVFVAISGSVTVDSFHCISKTINYLPDLT